MAKKDVNIHVKTPGAEEARRHLDDVAGSMSRVGEKTSDNATKLDQATTKMTRMGNVVNSLKTQVTAFMGAWLGLSGVQKVVDYLIQSLERIKQLQQEIADKTIEMSSVGQQLEMQTGTVGKQQQWSQKALGIQKAGGIADINTVGQMLTSMDITFASRGGIKTPEVMTIASQLAPFVGANQLSSKQVGGLFGFAGSAGVAPTAEAYKDYFAKVQAGYTASKSTNFGAYVEGLQQAGTAYMTSGGTLEGAISSYAGTLSVTANEALAATVMEQSARLSSGGYEKPRQAIENALGVSFNDLAMDERHQALLAYAASIPESRRIQRMTKESFAPELASNVGKLVSGEAVKSSRAASRAVGSASASELDKTTNAYLDSVLGRERIVRAGADKMKAEAGPAFTGWQQRLKRKRAEFEVVAAKGEDSWKRPDSVEPEIMAMEEIAQEAFQIWMDSDKTDTDAFDLWNRLENYRMGWEYRPYNWIKPDALAGWEGQKAETGLAKLKSRPQPQVTNIIYDHSTNYQRPHESATPRYSQD